MAMFLLHLLPFLKHNVIKLIHQSQVNFIVYLNASTTPSYCLEMVTGKETVCYKLLSRWCSQGVRPAADIKSVECSRLGDLWESVIYFSSHFSHRLFRQSFCSAFSEKIVKNGM